MDVLPLFTSDHSICDSVLTLSKDIFKKVEEEKDGKKLVRETTEVEIKATMPVSIFAIAKLHGVEQVILVDSSMSSYWEAYKIAKSFKLQLVYGLKIAVADDFTKKDPDSVLTESNVIIFCRNGDGYKDLIKISSQAHLEGGYHHPRTSWKALNEKWTDNLQLALPFYSSFIAKNLMRFGNTAMPQLDNLGAPYFFKEEHGLPFDDLITEALDQYCNANQYSTTNTHTVYYYKDDDALSYQVLKCIYKRSLVVKPQLDHFGSDKFSFEDYLRKIGKPL